MINYHFENSNQKNFNFKCIQLLFNICVAGKKEKILNKTSGKKIIGPLVKEILWLII